ncbi:MAG: IMP cyclohydrolase [Catonella sp.]|jgi:IMP cyclohydrolase|nr:IMP cyclohydrolase [Catonella sp.]MDY6355630.1 IMP cyclohydrolase [Catonella sp.]
MKDIYTEIGSTSYPGRGIVIGLTDDGRRAAIAYFIMGRSENSRNRIFVADGSGIRTEAFDPSKLVDPSLIIYSPVRTFNKMTIVTNGDQTDTVFDFLKSGKSFEQALMTRKFEPDAPNFTPRISGILEVSNGKYTYELSILKSNDGDENECVREFFTYDLPKAGEGHFIHTYMGDGSPLPSFSGEPTKVNIPSDIGAFTEGIWNALNVDNKVSLFTRFIDLATGNYESRIVNKNC